MRATEQPDELAAEARRWVCQAGWSTDPAIVAAVLKALARYYDDLIVVRGIIRWRLGRRSS